MVNNIKSNCTLTQLSVRRGGVDPSKNVRKTTNSYRFNRSCSHVVQIACANLVDNFKKTLYTSEQYHLAIHTFSTIYTTND